MTERANSEMACDPRIRKSARLGALPGTGASRGRRPRAPASLRPRSPGPAVPSLRSAPRAMSGVPPNRIPPPAPPPALPAHTPRGCVLYWGRGDGEGDGKQINSKKSPLSSMPSSPPPGKKRRKIRSTIYFFRAVGGLRLIRVMFAPRSLLRWCWEGH